MQKKEADKLRRVQTAEPSGIVKLSILFLLICVDTPGWTSRFNPFSRSRNYTTNSSVSFSSDDSTNSVIVEHEHGLEQLLNHSENCKEIEQLKGCFATDNVSQTVSNKIFKILRVRLLPQLPKSTKTPLKCDIKFDIKNMKADDNTTGQFFYFGIGCQLEKIVNTELHESDISFCVRRR